MVFFFRRGADCLVPSEMSRRALRLKCTIRGKARQGPVALAGAVVAAVALTGCAADSDRQFTSNFLGFTQSARNPSMEAQENTVEYSVVPTSRAMVHAPDALIVLERPLGGGLDQRIVLPNATPVRGDNVILARAHAQRPSGTRQFSMDEVQARFGGLPAPFEQLNERALSGGEDALGSFVYASVSPASGVQCVLVLRRLTVGARPLPRGTQALDVVLRNCINGTVEQALAPAGVQTLATGGGAGPIYTLSPHAAPRR